MLTTMKRKILLSAMLFLSLTSLGQFKGTILDSQTKKPVSNASISLAGNQGTISNINGAFEMELGDYPIIFTISHLSYHSKEVVINTDLQSGLTIYLDPNTVSINEVVVNAERIKRYLVRKNFYVLDYEFLDEKICLIGYENRQLSKGRLLVLNELRDTIANLPIKKPESFYQDAFNNLHLITKDSVFQLYFVDGDMHLLYPTHRKDVPMEFFQLEYVKNSKFLFKNISIDGRSHSYLLIDTIKQTKEEIKTIVDHKLMYNAKRTASYSLSARNAPNRAAVRELTKEMMEAMRDATERYFYSTSIIHQSIHSQFFRHKESYVIFDNINKRIIHYNSDFKPIKNIKRKFPKHHQRSKLVIQDAINGKFYWVYYQGSKVLLGEIDPDKGIIISQQETPNFPFIENIKIIDGKTWFTYQPRLGETTRSLFKMN